MIIDNAEEKHGFILKEIKKVYQIKKESKLAMNQDLFKRRGSCHYSYPLLVCTALYAVSATRFSFPFLFSPLPFQNKIKEAACTVIQSDSFLNVVIYL